MFHRRQRPRRLLATITMAVVAAAALLTTAEPAAASSYDSEIRIGTSEIPDSIASEVWTTVRVNVRNDGTETWPAGGPIRLGTGNGAGTGSDEVNDVLWGNAACGGYTNSVVDARILLCHDVAPGEWTTFEFQINAPAGSASTVDLEMRMVYDGVTWFGDDDGKRIGVSGGSGPGPGPGPGPDPGRPACEDLGGNRIRVSSWDRADAVCPVPGNLIDAWLIEPHSNASCDGNWTFYQSTDSIMTQHGCRATFGYRTSDCITVRSSEVADFHRKGWWGGWYFFARLAAQQSNVTACTDGVTVTTVHVGQNFCPTNIYGPYGLAGVSSHPADPVVSGAGTPNAFVRLDCTVQFGIDIKVVGTGVKIGRDLIFNTNYAFHVDGNGRIAPAVTTDVIALP